MKQMTGLVAATRGKLMGCGPGLSFCARPRDSFEHCKGQDPRTEPVHTVAAALGMTDGWHKGAERNCGFLSARLCQLPSRGQTWDRAVSSEKGHSRLARNLFQLQGRTPDTFHADYTSALLCASKFSLLNTPQEEMCCHHGAAMQAEIWMRPGQQLSKSNLR